MQHYTLTPEATETILAGLKKTLNILTSSGKGMQSAFFSAVCFTTISVENVFARVCVGIL